jgi:hypothetical protein
LDQHSDRLGHRASWQIVLGISAFKFWDSVSAASRFPTLDRNQLGNRSPVVSSFSDSVNTQVRSGVILSLYFTKNQSNETVRMFKICK